MAKWFDSVDVLLSLNNFLSFSLTVILYFLMANDDYCEALGVYDSFPLFSYLLL